MITEDKLERLVLDNIKPAIQAYIAKYDVHTAAPDKIKNEASKLNDNLKNLKELFINGYIEFEEFKSRCDELQKKLDEITEPPKPRNLELLKEFLTLDIENIYCSFSLEEKRAFWSSIINKIYMNDNK